VNRAEVFRALTAEMTGLGFRRWRSDGEYVMDLGEGFEGWCSFADRTRQGGRILSVAPFAGVRCTAVEERIARWCGDVVPGWVERSYVATVSTNVGYLRREAGWSEHVLDLTEGIPVEVVQGLLADVTDVALGFFREAASYAGAARALRHGKGQMPDRRLERLPLVLALRGDLEEAHRELDVMRRTVEEGDCTTPRYLRYLAGFEEEFPRTVAR
jgi:hypothetical protein